MQITIKIKKFTGKHSIKKVEEENLKSELYKLADDMVNGDVASFQTKSDYQTLEN